MAQIKRITLHPLREDGTIDTSINLYPKTLSDGIVDREGNPVEFATSQELSNKQDTLVSGVNIKTINDQSILGSGNIVIQGGGGDGTWGSITGTLSDQTDLQNALNEKQDNLISGTTIKTINGNSVLGSGNISITTYQPFDPSWPVDSSHTAKQFCDVLDSDENVTIGMGYFGGAKWSDKPEGLANGDVVVEVLEGPNHTKAIHLIMTSSSVYPYRWEYTYWSHGSNSGWRGVQPEITSSNKLSASLVSGLANVATSGSYNDLSNKPTIPTVPTDVSAFNNDAGYITKSVDDLTNYTLSSSLASVATSGNYSDLSNTPDLSDMATETWVGNQGYLKSVSWDTVTDKPSFASVATSGSYTDLKDKPSIPAAQIQSDWNQSDNTKLDFIKNKPTIPVVSYPVTDVKVDGTSVLDGTVAKITLPTIPTNVSSFNNDAGYITSSALSGYATETWVGNQGYLTSVSWSTVTDKPNFATVATSGSYNDLSNKPTIPSYSAGTGIDITSNAISVDSSVVALQTDLPSGSIDINFNGTATGTTAILNNIIVDTTTYTITSTRGTAASGGTTLSLVNTGDMYTWNNKQNSLTTSSVSDGTPVSVIGFDSSNNLVKGVASIVQDLTSNTAFTLDATAWNNLKINHYASISSPTMTGFDISKELVNIKASINSIPYIIKLVKNENYSYSGLFFIEDNASALYELTAYYNGSVIILRCAQVGSFTFSGTYIVTMNFNESGLSDKSYVRVYDGQNTSGTLLFEDTTTSATPTQTLKCRSGYLYVIADGYETYISTSVTSGSITTDTYGGFTVSSNGEVLVDIDYDF